MKTINLADEVRSPTELKKHRQEVTDLLLEEGHTLLKCHHNLAESCGLLNEATAMGHKGPYQRVLLKNNVTQDSRSQSLPNCVEPWERKLELEPVEESSSDVQSMSTENWFKTWPECCDNKVKSNEQSPDLMPNQPEDTHVEEKPLVNCDNVAQNAKNTLSFSEALQNISLAYSPITKQLHLVDRSVDFNECNGNTTISKTKNDFEEFNQGAGGSQKTHKRNEPGSFSSTVSSLSDPSPSGSLLEADERSVDSIEGCELRTRRKSLSTFFNRNVFSWRSTPGYSSGSSVWKYFSRSKESNPNSPQHVVASSSALIQHPRPSNLPAKTQEEEQRHREEYQAMVTAAKKKEALNTAVRQKLQKQQLELEEQQANTTKHFLKHVLPNWDVMHSSKKTKELWWQGLPSSVRGKVWRLAIGNELNLTPQLYEICLSRAQNRLNSPEPSQYDSDVDQESSMDVIKLDISRTFPHLCIFQQGGPYSEVLHSLLAAYVCYRPDVGYVQGMSYIAAILILNMDELDAFVCFANLLNQPLHLAAFTLNQEQMEAYYDAYNEVFGYNLPKLCAHFESAKLTPDLYLLDWIFTVFAKAMPLDVACRVWDVFLRDGYEFLFRTALGILHLNQETLIGMDFLHGAQFLTHLPDDLSSDQLFKSIQSVSTGVGKQTFCQIVEKYSLNSR